MRCYSGLILSFDGQMISLGDLLLPHLIHCYVLNVSEMNLKGYVLNVSKMNLKGYAPVPSLKMN